MWFSASGWDFDLERDGAFLVSASLFFALILSVMGLSFRLYEANMEDRQHGHVQCLEGNISASCVGLVTYMGYLVTAIFYMNQLEQANASSASAKDSGLPSFTLWSAANDDLNDLGSKLTTTVSDSLI